MRPELPGTKSHLRALWHAHGDAHAALLGDLSLPDRSGVGTDERAPSNLVPVQHPGMSQRTGMAGTADGSGAHALLPPGQLFSLVSKLKSGQRTVPPQSRV